MDPSLENNKLPNFNQGKIAKLNIPRTSKEVEFAIKSILKKKPLGQDGFTVIFWVLKTTPKFSSRTQGTQHILYSWLRFIAAEGYRVKSAKSQAHGARF